MWTNPRWLSGIEVCVEATNKKRLPQDCLQVRHVMISVADYIFCKLWSKTNPFKTKSNGLDSSNTTTSGMRWILQPRGNNLSAQGLQCTSNTKATPNITLKGKVILRPTVGRPVCPGVRPQLGPVTNFSFSLKFSLDTCWVVNLWRPLWREDWSVIYCCCWSRQRDSRLYFVVPLFETPQLGGAGTG
jgi:hypothetical protein